MAGEVEAEAEEPEARDGSIENPEKEGKVKRERDEGKGSIWKKITGVLSKLNPLAPLVERAGVEGPEFGTESLAAKVSGTEIESYPVGQAQVFISREGDKAYYGISEPSLNGREMAVYRDLLQNFYFSLDPEVAAAEKPMKYLEGAIWDAAEELGMLDEVREKFPKYRYFLHRDGLGYGKIHVPMNDPRVEEITLTSYEEPVRVVHRDFTEFGWLETNVSFRSEMKLRNYNQKMAQGLGEALTAAAPMVDATTKEGHRISLTFGDEVTHPSSSFTVRKHREKPLSLAHLVDNGTLSPLMAAYLWQVFSWRGFPLIIGGVGAGKSTLLNALLACISPEKKMVTIEETLELDLPAENWHRFHTREKGFGMGSEYEIDTFELTKAVMRHRPDYITVGEVRGKEIKTLVHAVSLGHGGSCTMHAESPDNALTRMKASPMSLAEGEILLTWCMPLIRRVRRPSGKVVRRVTDLEELNPSEEGEPELKGLFTYDYSEDSFSPDSVPKLVDCSPRLSEAADTKAGGLEGLKEELKDKSEFLEKRVEREELAFDEFVSRVREFHSA